MRSFSLYSALLHVLVVALVLSHVKTSYELWSGKQIKAIEKIDFEPEILKENILYRYPHSKVEITENVRVANVFESSSEISITVEADITNCADIRLFTRKWFDEAFLKNGGEVGVTVVDEGKIPFHAHIRNGSSHHAFFLWELPEEDVVDATMAGKIRRLRFRVVHEGFVEIN